MTPWHFGRSREQAAGDEPAPAPEPEYVQIDPGQLQSLFAAPKWLRDAGVSSWLLVGVTLLTGGVIWLLSLTSTIVMPLLTAGIVAAVASPLVRILKRAGIPRGAGAGLVMLSFVVLAIGVTALVVGGITQQASEIAGQLDKASAKIEDGLTSMGIDRDSASQAAETGGDSLDHSVSGLLKGVASGIASIASLAFFLAMTALSLFFLLKDGPQIRRWVEGRMGVPDDVAHIITQRLIQSLRGYFFGVTIVALWNVLLISVGAWVLGVPSIGTLAIVTFIGAYIPYLGAWAAGAFAVLVALGGVGPDAAIAMAVIVLLANGVLQQLVQPIAYGAALGIHPLAVLVVTIGGGALFGAVGLILGAPVTSAIVRITADLANSREPADQPAEPSGGAEAAAPA